MKRTLTGFQNERNFVDFVYSFNSVAERLVSSLLTRTAIVLVVAWFCYLIFGISQLKKIMGLNQTCSNASAKVLSYMLTIMLLGVATAFLLDVSFDAISRISDPAAYIANGYDSKMLMTNSIIVGSTIFIIIEIL